MSGAQTIHPGASLGLPAAWTDQTGTALRKPDGGERRMDEPAYAVRGEPAIDFSTDLGASNTMVAQGGTCTIAWNPTGWHDGTGCLDWTHTGAFPTIRAMLTGSLPFALDTDDGFGIEFMIPTPVSEAVSTSIGFLLGSGAVSAGSLPPIRTEWGIWYGNAGAGVQKFEGTVYRRFRFDIANSDLKMGPVDANVPTNTGGGIVKHTPINWWCIYSSSTNWQGKTIKIKRVTKGGRARPQLILTQDNQTRYLQTMLAAKMAANGWLPNPQYMTLSWNSDNPAGTFGSIRENLLSAWNDGADMNANDTVDRNISSLDYATMLAAAQQLKTDMAASGFGGSSRGQQYWVYNDNGYASEPIRALKDAGYIAGRAGILEGRYVFPEGGIRNSMRLGSMSWDGAPLQSMKDVIDRVIEYGVTANAYNHLVYPKSKLVYDLPAASAIGATESPAAYLTRVTGLAETATIAYCNAKGIGIYTSWWEDVSAMLDYLKTKQLAGLIDVPSTSQWMRMHGLTAATP